ncbi:MAG TPA: MFS transporter [Polyangia bacterium]
MNREKVVERPAPLAAILGTTFFGSVSGGAFWAGLFFVTARHYHFSPTRNLVLAASMGALSSVASWLSGRIAARFPPRSVVLTAFALWAAVALLPVLFPRSEPALWGAAFVASVTSAIIWPIVESYVSAGRHGPDMRSAIGWFNVVWTPATAIPLFVMPAVARLGLTWCLGLTGVINLLAFVAALGLPRQPVAHQAEAARAALGPEYRALARSTSWSLTLSYVISTAIAPILPFRLAAVGVGGSSSMVAGLWMAARFVTFFAMWRTAFWHGRWGTSVAGGVAVVVGFASILLAKSVVGLVLGLVLFGVGMGLIYYAALYYSLAVGHAAVDAGGTFEALIGLGSCVGPLLGSAGELLGGAAHAGAATLAVTAVILALAARGVVGPYVTARRQRES